MTKHPFGKTCAVAFWLTAIALSGLLSPSTALAQKFMVTAVAEKKIAQLPAGPLYWKIETFPTLAQAQAAVGPTSLAAEISGKVWLFTLGTKGAPGHGGTPVAEVGPVPHITAPEYLLRINHAGGPPGAKTRVHSHPGSEAFYVLEGRMGQRTPKGMAYAEAGQSMNGHDAGTTMQVFNPGAVDLNQLVMFVVDATKPFSVPAKF